MDMKVPLPSLKELCFIKSAIALWSTDEVVKIIVAEGVSWQRKKDEAPKYVALPGISRGKGEVGRRTSNNVLRSYFEEFWTNTKLKVTENVTKLPLPTDTKAQLSKYTYPIYTQIREWLKTTFNLHDLFDYDTKFDEISITADILHFYLTSLTWSCLGKIDLLKTAKLMIRDQRLQANVRFRYANLYSLVEEAYNLGREYGEVSKEEINKYIRGRLLRNDNHCDVLKRYSFKAREGKELVGKEFEVKMFWSSLTTDEREKALNPFETKNMSSETVRYLLSTMSLEEQMICFEKGYLNRLAEWPYHNLFLQISTTYGKEFSTNLWLSVLDYFWVYLEKEPNAFHAELYRPFLLSVPLKVTFIYSSVKIAQKLFHDRPRRCDLELMFKNSNSEDLEVQYDFSLPTYLVDLHNIYKKYIFRDLESTVDTVKILLRCYAELRDTETTTLKEDVRECIQILRKEFYSRMIRGGCGNYYRDCSEAFSCCNSALLNYVSFIEEGKIQTKL